MNGPEIRKEPYTKSLSQLDEELKGSVRHRSASFDRLRTGAHGKHSRQALQRDRVLSFSFQLSNGI
jgi:hypothetical protein